MAGTTNLAGAKLHRMRNKAYERHYEQQAKLMVVMAQGFHALSQSSPILKPEMGRMSDLLIEMMGHRYRSPLWPPGKTPSTNFSFLLSKISRVQSGIVERSTSTLGTQLDSIISGDTQQLASYTQELLSTTLGIDTTPLKDEDQNSYQKRIQGLFNTKRDEIRHAAGGDELVEQLALADQPFEQSEQSIKDALLAMAIEEAAVPKVVFDQISGLYHSHVNPFYSAKTHRGLGINYARSVFEKLFPDKKWPSSSIEAPTLHQEFFAQQMSELFPNKTSEEQTLIQQLWEVETLSLEDIRTMTGHSSMSSLAANAHRHQLREEAIRNIIGGTGKLPERFNLLLTQLRQSHDLSTSLVDLHQLPNRNDKTLNDFWASYLQKEHIRLKQANFKTETPHEQEVLVRSYKQQIIRKKFHRKPYQTPQEKEVELLKLEQTMLFCHCSIDPSSTRLSSEVRQDIIDKSVKQMSDTVKVRDLFVKITHEASQNPIEVIAFLSATPIVEVIEDIGGSKLSVIKKHHRAIASSSRNQNLVKISETLGLIRQKSASELKTIGESCGLNRQSMDNLSTGKLRQTVENQLLENFYTEIGDSKVKEILKEIFIQENMTYQGHDISESSDIVLLDAFVNEKAPIVNRFIAREKMKQMASDLSFTADERKLMNQICYFQGETHLRLAEQIFNHNARVKYVSSRPCCINSHEAVSYLA